MRLYDHRASGNCMKARIALRQLEIPYEAVTVDLFRRETRTPEHMARNPDGRVPAETIAAAQDWFFDNGYVPTKVDLSKVIDNQFADYAVAQLGPYQPQRPVASGVQGVPHPLTVDTPRAAARRTRSSCCPRPA